MFPPTKKVCDSLNDIEEGMNETERISTLHDSTRDLGFGSVIGYDSEHSDKSGRTAASRSLEPDGFVNHDKERVGLSKKAQPKKDKFGTKGSSGSKVRDGLLSSLLTLNMIMKPQFLVC